MSPSRFRISWRTVYRTLQLGWLRLYVPKYIYEGGLTIALIRAALLAISWSVCTTNISKFVWKSFSNKNCRYLSIALLWPILISLSIIEFLLETARWLYFQHVAIIPGTYSKHLCWIVTQFEKMKHVLKHLKWPRGLLFEPNHWSSSTFDKIETSKLSVLIIWMSFSSITEEVITLSIWSQVPVVILHKTQQHSVLTWLAIYSNNFKIEGSNAKSSKTHYQNVSNIKKEENLH